MAIDRTGLIELLERLGAESDQTVLEAARELHRKAAESGLSWDELIRADLDAAARNADETPAEEAPPPSPDAAEVVRLIDRLLRKGVSETLREDLAELRRSAVAGTLDPMDSRYVRALARRLGA